MRRYEMTETVAAKPMLFDQTPSPPVVRPPIPEVVVDAASNS